MSVFGDLKRRMELEMIVAPHDLAEPRVLRYQDWFDLAFGQERHRLVCLSRHKAKRGFLSSRHIFCAHRP